MRRRLTRGQVNCGLRICGGLEMKLTHFFILSAAPLCELLLTNGWGGVLKYKRHIFDSIGGNDS